MGQLKVLFVTLRALEINSSVTISNLGLLKGLVESACEVDVLMPEANTQLNNYDQSIDFGELNVIRIQNDRTYERLVTGASNRLKEMIVSTARATFYKVSLYDNSLRLINKGDISALGGTEYDLVISTSDPKTSHRFVDRLIKQGLNYRLWVQHWGDPMTLDITKKSIIPEWYIKREEYRVLSGADLIFYVSPLTWKAQSHLFAKYATKMHFLPLPYVAERTYGRQNNARVTLGYFGDYNSKVRDILPLYDFCKNNKDYHLIIAGMTDLSLDECDNITIYPRLKQHEITELEARCDVLVSICNKLGTQIPGKIYYYSATDKPILVILDGEYREAIEKYLSQYQRFHLCDNNQVSIGDNIRDLPQNAIINAPCNAFSPRSVVYEMLQIASKHLKGHLHFDGH